LQVLVGLLSAVDYKQTAMFTMIYDGVAAAAAVEAVHPRVVNSDASTSDRSRRYDLTDRIQLSLRSCWCRHAYSLRVFNLDQRRVVPLHSDYTL